jgi:hypothetical protein
MSVIDCLYQKDILSQILLYLHFDDFRALMLCDKQLLYLIGKSQTWHNNNLNLNKYKKLCEIVSQTSLIKTNLKIQPYYEDHYYCFRYSQFKSFEFNGYLTLDKIISASDEDLKTFREIIDDYYDSKRFNIELWRYDVLLRNIQLVRQFACIDDEILEKIYLCGHNYDLEKILINTNNLYINTVCNIGYKFHPKTHPMNFRYINCDCETKYDYFTIPKYFEIGNFTKIDPTISIDVGHCLSYIDSLESTWTNKYFAFLAEHTNIHMIKWYEAVRLILRTYHLSFQKTPVGLENYQVR